MDPDGLIKAVIDWARLTIGTVLIIAMIIIAIFVMGAVAAEQQTTYSNDHFTVDESSDNQSVLVTYEVETRLSDEAELGERRDRMNKLTEVSACANARIDVHIRANNKSAIDSADLTNVTSQCETTEVSVAAVTVTDTIK